MRGRGRAAPAAAAALLAARAAGAAPHRTTPEEHGAQGDGRADDTAAIRAALTSCPASGGCVVSFAASYLSGPLRVNASDVELSITGTLAMLPRARYPTAGQANFLTAGAGVRGLRVAGGGSVDGGGLEWWPCKLTGCWRPHLMSFGGVAGLAIDGLQLRNPPNHFIEVVNCRGVRVRNITARAPHTSPNTDGMNFYGGSDQSLTDSVISNGDDCVSVVPEPNSCVARPEECQGGNVLIDNVLCDGGHGMSIGSVRHGTVRNVTFRNITLTSGPTQGKYSGGGCRIKTYLNGTGSIAGVTYENIRIEGVAYPIQLQGNYCPGGPSSCPPGQTAVSITNITFSNVTGHGKSSLVGDFACDPISPCENIRLDGVQLASGSKDPAYFNCDHASGSASADTQPTSCL